MWDDIKEFIGGSAPLIGGLIGGGPGGVAIGKLVSKALGVNNDPEEIKQALKNDPDALLKIERLEKEHERELRSMTLQAETAQIAQINETMRAELKHDGDFKSGWRPFIGWVTGFSFGGLMLALVYAIFSEPSKANDIIESATVIISIMLTVLGVNIKKRSDDKATMLGKETGGILAAVAERIKKK